MREELKQHVIDVCNIKIEKKGITVSLSFYAFFSNRNDNPELLMEAAEWWIMTHKLNHFEKAIKIKKMVEEYLMLSIVFLQTITLTKTCIGLVRRVTFFAYAKTCHILPSDDVSCSRRLRRL